VQLYYALVQALDEVDAELCHVMAAASILIYVSSIRVQLLF
jgi:hypothetical protein